MPDIRKFEVGAEFTLEAAVLVPMFLLIMLLSIEVAVSLYQSAVAVTDITENLEIDQVKDFRLFSLGEELWDKWGNNGK